MLEETLRDDLSQALVVDKRPLVDGFGQIDLLDLQFLVMWVPAEESVSGDGDVYSVREVAIPGPTAETALFVCGETSRRGGWDAFFQFFLETEPFFADLAECFSSLPFSHELPHQTVFEFFFVVFRIQTAPG